MFSSSAFLPFHLITVAVAVGNVGDASSIGVFQGAG